MLNSLAFLKTLPGRTPWEHTGSILRAPKDAAVGDVKKVLPVVLAQERK
jgi:hypothetical protein